MCGQDISVRMLMCRRHWKMVPLSQQRVLWRAWEDAKQTGGVLGNVAYGRARDACIEAVERRLPKPKDEPKDEQGMLGFRDEDHSL